jgi:hypothetical protein
MGLTAGYGEGAEGEEEGDKQEDEGDYTKVHVKVGINFALTLLALYVL